MLCGNTHVDGLKGCVDGLVRLMCSAATGKKSKEEAEKAAVEQEALTKITAALEAGRHCLSCRVLHQCVQFMCLTERMTGFALVSYPTECLRVRVRESTH